MEDQIKLSGKLKLKLFDSDGNIKQEKDITNLIVTAGKVWIATLMQSGTGTVMSHMALGTGNTAAAAGDTTLETEIGASRTALAVAGGTRTNNSIEFEAVFGAGVGTGNVTEAGIFNDATTGTMLARTVFTTIAKGAADSLTVTWTVTVG